MKKTLTWIAGVSFLLCQSQTQTQSVSFSWVKQWGGNTDDGAMVFKRNTAGDLFISGFFSGSADLDPGPGVFNVTGGQRDLFISKFDAAGNFVWGKTMVGGTNCDVTDLVLDSSGNILITGWFAGVYDFDPGQSSYTLSTIPNIYYTESFVCKLDPQGNFLWAKKMGQNQGNGAFSMKTDKTGNIYVTGIFDGTSDFDPGPGVFNMTSKGREDAFILKLDVNGNFLWAKQIGDQLWNHGRSIVVDGAGNVIVAGEFQQTVDLDPGPGVFTATTLGMMDIFVVKLDPSGNFVWAKTIGGTASDEGASLVLDPGGNIYLSGRYGAANTDFDPGPGVYTMSFNGWVDMFIMKLSASGNFIWCKGIGGSEYDSPEHISLDQSGNLYVAGRFRMNVDFDPGPGTYTLASRGSGSDDGFIMRLDPNGQFVWAAQIHGNMNYATCIQADNQDVYVTGIFSNLTDFDPGPGTYTLNAPAFSKDAYLLKLSQPVIITPPATVGLEELAGSGASLNCFPVPFTQKLYVSTGPVSENARISLITLTGETVMEKPVEENKLFSLTADALPKGVYFVKLEDGSSTTYRKVVKE